MIHFTWFCLKFIPDLLMVPNQILSSISSHSRTYYKPQHQVPNRDIRKVNHALILLFLLPETSIINSSSYKKGKHRNIFPAGHPKAYKHFSDFSLEASLLRTFLIYIKKKVCKLHNLKLYTRLLLGGVQKRIPWRVLREKSVLPTQNTEKYVTTQNLVYEVWGQEHNK